MTKIYNIRFGVPLAFFILVATGSLADAAVLPPSPGFVNLANPTGRPECIFPAIANCIGSGNPSPGFTNFTNPTGRPECIVSLANCIGAGNPSPGFTSFTNPTGIPTTNPLFPLTADVVISTSVGMTSAFRIDLPTALDIPATLGVVANQTITNPEPTTLLLLGSGLAGLLLTRKFARRGAD